MGGSEKGQGRTLKVGKCQVVAIVGFVLPLLACQKSLPTAPSELTTGITIYQHADYLGESAHVTADIKDLKDFKGPCERIEYSGAPGSPVETHHEWDDCISSVRVSSDTASHASRLLEGGPRDVLGELEAEIVLDRGDDRLRFGSPMWLRGTAKQPEP